MLLRPFASLPSEMQNEAVKGYWLLLSKRRILLLLKRMTDVALALLLLVPLAPVMLGIAGAVRLGSPGGALVRRSCRGRYNRPFAVCRFRTEDREDGTLTRVGGWLRRTRLDGLPQLFQVLTGSMSLVGPPPEQERRAAGFTDRQLAQLLLRPGLTSPAALVCGQEAGEDGDRELLLKKAELNLQYLEGFTPLGDLRLLAAAALRMIFPQRTR